MQTRQPHARKPYRHKPRRGAGLCFFVVAGGRYYELSTLSREAQLALKVDEASLMQVARTLLCERAYEGV